MIRVDTATHTLFWPGGSTPCAIGKNGVVPAQDKREGDGKSPLGTYPLRTVYYRADRIAKPITDLPVVALEPDMGWCDASDDINYNRFVRHPYGASAEYLWRVDGLYDIIVALGHNDAPVVPGLGSAIFLHCCKYDDLGALKPTLGCVAVPRDVLVAVLAAASVHAAIRIT